MRLGGDAEIGARLVDLCNELIDATVGVEAAKHPLAVVRIVAAAEELLRSIVERWNARRGQGKGNGIPKARRICDINMNIISM